MEMRHCTRCRNSKHIEHFIEDFKFCRNCTTKKEIDEYIKTDIIKALEGLDARQKQRIIKALLKDQRARNAESKGIAYSAIRHDPNTGHSI